jgi:hypothetical protein
MFSAPVCRFIRIGNGHGEITGVQPWDKSFEARTLFAVEMANGLDNAEGHAVVDQLLGHLRKQILDDSGDKDGLVVHPSKLDTWGRV